MWRGWGQLWKGWVNQAEKAQVKLQIFGSSKTEPYTAWLTQSLSLLVFPIPFASTVLILLTQISAHLAGVDIVRVPAQTQIPIRNLGREINWLKKERQGQFKLFCLLQFLLAMLCAYFFNGCLDINEIKLIKRRIQWTLQCFYFKTKQYWDLLRAVRQERGFEV